MSDPKQNGQEHVKSRFDDDEEVDRAIKIAVREAIRVHKRAGNPIAVSQNGKVVIIQPEDIVIPEGPL
jgi:hypothetical protein